ncbi:MAG: hypothetical protein IIA14_11210 [SAR324 cluster bacterium]|nr:hypothetical protein [SAR324 cluster bacterium]
MTMLRMKVGAACLLMVLAIAFFAPAPAAGRGIKFWISNLEGKRFDSRKHKGPIIISFFFVDCVPCIVEVPQLYKLMSEKYPKAALLYVDPLAEDSSGYIKEFADGREVPYAFFYHDPLSTMAKKFFVGKQFVFPTIVGVDSRRKEVFRVHDLKAEALAKIEALLGS